MSCPDCRIELTHLVTLGSSGGADALPDEPDAIVRAANGNYFIAPGRSNELPRAFDSNGEFLGLLGRLGEGPGELVNPGFMATGPDATLSVHDLNTGRVSIFRDEPPFEFVDSYTIREPAFNMFGLPDGAFVHNQASWQSEAGGFALHRLDSAGNHVFSFDPFPAGDDPARWIRSLAVSDSLVWTLPIYSGYQLRAFDLGTGAPRDSLRVDASWYRPDESRHRTVDNPVRPLAVDLWHSPREAQLWVVGWTPGDDWRDHIGQPYASAEGPVYQYDRNEVYDAVIDVVSSADGGLIASARVDHPIWAVISRGIVASFREDAVGWWLIDIYEVSMR